MAIIRFYNVKKEISVAHCYITMESILFKCNTDVIVRQLECINFAKIHVKTEFLCIRKSKRE